MARMRRLIGAAAVLSLMVMCAFPGNPPEKKQPTAVVDPDYVILRPVYPSSINGATASTVDGQTVYFLRAERILDLRNLALKSVNIIATPSGSYAIGVSTNPDGNRLLRTWTAAHLGKQLGVFVDGRLVSAPFIRTPVDDMIVIEGDFSKPTAEATAKRIQCGGAA
jgi:preprotein translocase subunit SecD